MQIFRQKYWRLLYMLPFVFAFCFYFQTTGFGFVWDDRDLLVRSPNLRDWTLIWSAAGQAFLNYQVYFRPLPLVSLGLEQLVSEGSAFVPHLDATLLFSSNCLLLAVLSAVVAEQRQMEPKIALWIGVGAGIFYALHPVLIESVAWVSCRFDLFLTFFGLSLFLADRLVPRGFLRAAMVGTLFFLAALSKEMALGIAPALPCLHLLLIKPRFRSSDLARHFAEQGHWHSYLGITLGGVAYLCLRYLSLSDLYEPAASGFEVLSYQHLLVVLKSIGAYLRYAAWPFTGLGPLHTLYLPLSVTDPLVVLGILYTCAMALVLIGTFRGYRGSLGFMLPFSAALMPVINIFPLQIGDNYMHERFLNFPLTFFCMGAAFLTREITASAGLVSRRIRMQSVAAVLLFWFGLSVLNLRTGLPFWKDSVSLWTLANMREPDSRMAQTNLQTAYVNAGLYKEAIEFTDQISLRRKGQLHFEHVENYMLALAGLGQPTAKLIGPMVERLYAADPEGNAKEFASIYASMAWLYLMEGEVAEAQALYKKSLGVLPRQPAANMGMAISLMAQDQPDLAEPYYESWLKYAHPSGVSHWKAEIPNVVRKVRRAHEERLRAPAVERNPDERLDNAGS